MSDSNSGDHYDVDDVKGVAAIGEGASTSSTRNLIGTLNLSASGLAMIVIALFIGFSAILLLLNSNEEPAQATETAAIESPTQSITPKSTSTTGPDIVVVVTTNQATAIVDDFVPTLTNTPLEPIILSERNYVTNEDEPLVDQDLLLAISAQNPDRDLFIRIISQTTDGALTLGANGTFTYQPDSDFFGKDSFIYEVCEQRSVTVCANNTVTITVIPVNDPPVISITNFTEILPFTAADTNGIDIVAFVEITDDLDSTDQMTIQVEFVGENGRPDGVDEYVQFTFREAVSPNNLESVNLPPASIEDYIDMLASMVYINSTTEPTDGCRRIAIQVFDESGLGSNVETILIEVGDGDCSSFVSQ